MKLKCKNSHLKTLTPNVYGRRIQLFNTIKNPDKTFKDYIINHNQNFDEYFVKCNFKLDFNNCRPHIKTEFLHNTTNINLKRYLLCWIEYFILKGYKFSHINKMDIKTISDRRT